MAALQDHFSIVKSSLASHYDPIFNFYFAKDVNDLCYSRVHAKEVIRFEDLLRYDCEDEMLKRYYHLKEASRINLLAGNYQTTKNTMLEIESFKIKPHFYISPVVQNRCISESKGESKGKRRDSNRMKPIHLMEIRHS